MNHCKITESCARTDGHEGACMFNEGQCASDGCTKNYRHEGTCSDNTVPLCLACGHHHKVEDEHLGLVDHIPCSEVMHSDPPCKECNTWHKSGDECCPKCFSGCTLNPGHRSDCKDNDGHAIVRKGLAGANAFEIRFPKSEGKVTEAMKRRNYAAVEKELRICNKGAEAIDSEHHNESVSNQACSTEYCDKWLGHDGKCNRPDFVPCTTPNCSLKRTHLGPCLASPNEYGFRWPVDSSQIAQCEVPGCTVQGSHAWNAHRDDHGPILTTTEPPKTTAQVFTMLNVLNPPSCPRSDHRRSLTHICTVNGCANCYKWGWCAECKEWKCLQAGSCDHVPWGPPDKMFPADKVHWTIDNGIASSNCERCARWKWNGAASTWKALDPCGCDHIPWGTPDKMFPMTSSRCICKLCGFGIENNHVCPAAKYIMTNEFLHDLDELYVDHEISIVAHKALKCCFIRMCKEYYDSAMNIAYWHEGQMQKRAVEQLQVSFPELKDVMFDPQRYRSSYE